MQSECRVRISMEMCGLRFARAKEGVDSFESRNDSVCGGQIAAVDDSFEKQKVRCEMANM